MYGKDARGNVKPHALRLVLDPRGTALCPLLVAPPNLADPAVAYSEGERPSGAADEDTADAAAAAADGGASSQTEHGFWSAKPIWSSESASTGAPLCAPWPPLPRALRR